MDRNSIEWKLENEWLQHVLEEARKQFDEKRDLKDRFRKDAVETQRQLWQDIGSVSISNGLEQIVDFMSFINAMKIQKRSHEFTKKLQDKYERMLLSPYFGRIDFQESGEEKAEKYYIGVANLIDDDYNVLIYDWRAPVSSMFYDYEIGKAKYKCPEGVIEGTLTLKRQYKINDGKLEYMFNSNLKIDDEILQDILSKSTDNKMKAIVTTIQREQNRVIRNEEYKNLIVQGPAGSGKTSIALHRIAYLLYRHRDKITPQNIIIFSPNEIFNDYISNVLPQLGEDNMFQMTFKDYMHKALGDGLIKENYCDMMEYILANIKDASYQDRMLSIKYKSSTEFIDILKRYIVHIEKRDRNFKDIAIRGRVIIYAKDLQQLYSEDYIQLPLKKRLQKIRERVLFMIEPYEKQLAEEIAAELRDSGAYVDNIEVMERSKAITKEEMKDVYHEIHRIAGFDLMDIYRELFDKFDLYSDSTNSEYRSIELIKVKNYTLESLSTGKLNYEDQPPLLYLKGALGDLPKTTDIKYVIIIFLTYSPRIIPAL